MTINLIREEQLKMKEKIEHVGVNSIMDGYLIALAIVMPWSNALFNMLLVSGLLLFLIGTLRGNFKLSKSFISLPILISMGLFLVLCFLSIVLRQDWEGMVYLNRIAVFAILPFLVFTMAGELSKKNTWTILGFYAHSTAILAFVTLVTAIVRWMFSFGGLTFSKSIVYEELSYALIHHQPIYFSLFVGFAMIGLVYTVLSNKGIAKYQFSLYIIEILFLLAFLFLLGSRTAIFTTFVTLLILGLFKSKRFFLLFLFIGSLFFVLSYSYNQSFKARIDHVLIFNTNFDYHSDWSYEGLALRYMTWNCSTSCIKENVWLGTGISESQVCLDQCYKENDYKSLLYFAEHQGTQYNSHNLFLDVFLKFGISGFVLILMIFLLFFSYAFKRRNLLMVLLLIFFCLNGLTESVLVREKGIIFFSFMLGFLSSIDQPRKDLVEEKGKVG